MIQYYAPLSAVMLGVVGSTWSHRSWANFALKCAFVATAMFGAIISAKVLPFGL